MRYPATMVYCALEMTDVWMEFAKERLSRVVHVKPATAAVVKSNQDFVLSTELVTQTEI